LQIQLQRRAPFAYGWRNFARTAQVGRPPSRCLGAYIGDTVGPLKDFLPEYREIEANLMKVILTKFGAPYPLPPEIKMADKMVLVAEMRQVNGWHDLADQIGVPDADVQFYDLPVFTVMERFQAAIEKYL
jgi:hypothetical protein